MKNTLEDGDIIKDDNESKYGSQSIDSHMMSFKGVFLDNNRCSTKLQ